jgi:hypothetical protein
MKTEIIKIEATDYGLTEDFALGIKAQFQPMLDKMVELETEFNEVVSLPIDDNETQKKAKALRNKYVKVRTATAEIHKQQKSFYLNGGRFVDGWKNAQIFASQGKEEKLEQIEKYAENLEKQRIAELHEQRLGEISQYLEPHAIAPNFGTMDADVWDAYYMAKKTSYDRRIAEQQKVEEEQKRIKESLAMAQRRKSELMEYWFLMDDDMKKLDFGTMTEKYYTGFLSDLKARKSHHEAEQERIRVENERIRQEQLEMKRQLDEERIKAEAERLKAQQERDRLNAELLKKEKEAREAERLKQLEEEKARKEAQKLAKAPVKKQLKAWVQGFDIADCPVHDQVGVDIIVKFEAFKAWALKSVENI